MSAHHLLALIGTLGLILGCPSSAEIVKPPLSSPTTPLSSPTAPPSPTTPRFEVRVTEASGIPYRMALDWEVVLECRGHSLLKEEREQRGKVLLGKPARFAVAWPRSCPNPEVEARFTLLPPWTLCHANYPDRSIRAGATVDLVVACRESELFPRP